ncbi:hypothetical protein IMG5_055180 [Ichthyophthirius multifiliis]|uniref:WD repeat protein n=1 Tax=Ichthyophthirius multifiliis TaxID=5932 RepID=G0QN46_ICHMU|nr:hypothetical protein IMG5_055180 [Ichthyophthirius multifiliis]EGR33375.1 hypothetical protein IMG5_055180 [Ichthyophthirius multifiliis]|eukprot:XP_004037361.1 hypothetical protein IMG5_055180 [Ichthyophthirius multifiliis]
MSNNLQDQQQQDNDSDEDTENPYVPKPYISKTGDSGEETLKEIQNFQIKRNRPKIKMQFIKKRKEFGQQCKLIETDANEKALEIKQQNDPFAHIKNKVIDIGLQASNPFTSSSTQTTWSRHVNQALQLKHEFNIVEMEDDNNDLLKFLDNVYPLMEEALQSNETIDIYQNDFDLFNSEDITTEGSELSNTIKELKTFSYINSKGRKVSSIEFQPPNQSNQKGKFIAASFVENLSFEERVAFQQKSHKFMIVFWDFSDQHSIDPILTLTTPLEIITFQFNPKDPNIIIGGAINGQILMWDLGPSNINNLLGKKGQKMTKDKSEIPELNPMIMSCLQDPASASAPITNEVIKKNVNSHKNPVLSLQWLPTTIEFNSKAILNLIVHPNGGECHQFASISCDGQILFWDKRFNYNEPKKNFDINTHQWKANYGLQLIRPEGGGIMGGAQIKFRKNQKIAQFTGTSDEGELFLVDWTATNAGGVGTDEKVLKIWQQERSYRPPVGLDVSNFFDDIILTLHDFNFSIWKHDVDVPIFDSAIIKNGQITCGQFSPSKPSVVIIGLNDGHIHIWDFLDQSHKATLIYHVGAKAISNIRYNDHQPQCLAVGDADGTIHILELPYSLWKNVGEQEKTMKEFWNREVLRVNYFKVRFQNREEEFKKEKEFKDFLQAEEYNQKKDESQQDEDEQIEREYQEFAKSYMNEVIYGIKTEKEEEKEKKKK